MQDTIEESKLQYFTVTFILLFTACIALVIISGCNINTKPKENFGLLPVVDKDDFPEDYAFNENRVFICMTTIPERLESQLFIDNIIRLLNETNKTNINIFISIPYEKRSDGTKYAIPEYLLSLERRNRRLILNRCNDYGPITKLSGPLLSDLVPDDACIIVCDDDQLYTRLLFIHLAIAAYKNPQDLISTQPVKKVFLNRKNKIQSLIGPFNTNTVSSEIMGFQGFSFIKRLLVPILDIDIPDSCFRIDDHTITFHLMKEDIVVRYLEPTRSRQRLYIEKLPESMENIDWPRLNEDEVDNKRYFMSLKCRDDFNLKGK